MMDGFARYSSSALLLLCVGCVEELPPIDATTSLRVEVTSPADLGSDESRLGDDQRDVSLLVTALDANGEVVNDFSGQLDVYVHHLGSLSPDYERRRTLATVTAAAGTGTEISLELPRVFGPAVIWVEHTRGAAPTYATGTSDTLWYRDPWLADVSTPEDEAALDALDRSPLEKKQIVIGSSRYGARGRMVVTGVYAQGYTVSDSECADDDGTPPCVTGDYDHIYVYTFSRPEEADVVENTPIVLGDAIETVGGGVSEFNGLTEIGFPRTTLLDEAADEARMPEPTVIDPAWIDTRIELERLESGLIAVEDAVLCPLDDDFDTYSQWKLDLGRGCRDAFNFITIGQVAEFDPTVYVGQTFPRVVGTLRPVNIGSFHVWIVFPRKMSDITLP